MCWRRRGRCRGVVRRGGEEEAQRGRSWVRWNFGARTREHEIRIAFSPFF